MFFLPWTGTQSKGLNFFHVDFIINFDTPENGNNKQDFLTDLKQQQSSSSSSLQPVKYKIGSSKFSSLANLNLSLGLSCTSFWSMIKALVKRFNFLKLDNLYLRFAKMLYISLTHNYITKDSSSPYLFTTSLTFPGASWLHKLISQWELLMQRLPSPWVAWLFLLAIVNHLSSFAPFKQSKIVFKVLHSMCTNSRE